MAANLAKRVAAALENEHCELVAFDRELAKHAQYIAQTLQRRDEPELARHARYVSAALTQRADRLAARGPKTATALTG